MTTSKTTAGHQVLKDRSAGLSPRQRAALILFDGKRTVQDVLAVTSPTGVTPADIDRLVQMGLVAEQGAAVRPPEFGPDSQPASLWVSVSPAPSANERYLRAYEVGIQLTAELGTRASHLLLAVEAAESLDELVELAPRLRAALLPLQFARFEAALHGR
ncbi:hypothetical protein [Ramlibacter montanisoli]|uniref:Uncharacterized protein n=1 Tax=Ramlibacter montanisoli TaxID=2732512 RepID=A0A849K2I1_9BURK|nr:hypothetical protein [Ramlibacter montanisoli]NNU42702.1 hypothetical protein [Ramlibacter montanisoli]